MTALLAAAASFAFDVPPWQGTMLGTEDTVPPPWTAPVSADASFACWGREYSLGGAGLVSAVRSGGEELLAAPVSVELNGKQLAFRASCATQGVSFAEYDLVSEGGDASVRARLRAEFDGFLWFDVTWGGADSGEVKSLKVNVPVRRDLVDGFDRCRFTRDDEPLPKGKTGTWLYDPGREPYFWLGNGSCGLMGGVDSLRGWRRCARQGGYRLVVTDSAATLVMDIVDVLFTPAEARTFGFYLEATPTKPKNLELAALPADKLERWCQTDAIFDIKWPGCYKEGRLEKFRKLQHAGKRVFYYASTTAVSPMSPLWERFGAEWTLFSSPTSGIVKSLSKTEAGRRAGAWTRGCMNSRSFFEYKLYAANGFLADPTFEVMDLYYDVAEPMQCHNRTHGCVWTDDFGHVNRDYDMKSIREFHKRLLRLLKKKNPKGVLYGHSGPSRTPADMFFERMVMGENYANAVRKKLSYYDVLTPEELRIKYASRSNETVIDMLPQIVRALQMHDRERLKTYDRTSPENDRAIRHCAAYYKIFDLNIWGNAANRFDGDQWIKADDAVTSLGPGRRYRAYYHADAPLKAVDGDPRFLWAVFSGRGAGLLILLNDTDETVTRSLVGDLAAFGFPPGPGRDIFSGEEFAFADSRLVVTLPPRESRFIRFGRDFSNTENADKHRKDQRQ